MSMYLVETVRAAYSTFPGSMHLTRLLPPFFSHPNLFIEMFFQYVRVSGSIVLLVKYNLSTIDMMTQGSTKRGH